MSCPCFCFCSACGSVMNEYTPGESAVASVSAVIFDGYCASGSVRLRNIFSPKEPGSQPVPFVNFTLAVPAIPNSLSAAGWTYVPAPYWGIHSSSKTWDGVSADLEPATISKSPPLLIKSPSRTSKALIAWMYALDVRLIVIASSWCMNMRSNMVSGSTGVASLPTFARKCRSLVGSPAACPTIRLPTLGCHRPENP